MHNDSFMGKIAGGVQQKGTLWIMHSRSCRHFGWKMSCLEQNVRVSTQYDGLVTQRA